MEQRKRRRGQRGSVLIAGIAAPVLLAAAAVFASPALGATTTVHTSETSVEIKKAGISLRYPSDWLDLPVTKQQLKAAKKVLAKDPELLAETESAMRNGVFRTLKFRAVATSGAPREGVVVQVLPGGGDPGLDGVIPIANQYFQQVGGTAENSGTVTPVGGKTAYRIDGQIPVTYATGTVKEAASILILPNRHGHVVLVEVASDDNEAGRTTIDAVLSSVRLTAA